MSAKPRRQDKIIGHPKSKYRNVRFDPETYATIRRFSDELHWSFARVVGEAVLWYLGISPILQRVEEKSKLLSGKPFISMQLKDYLLDLETQLDEAILESTTTVPTKSTEE
jgi:hypothetical protein